MCNGKLIAYKRITKNGITVSEHRLIFEKIIKRKLKDKEVYH